MKIQHFMVLPGAEVNRLLEPSNQAADLVESDQLVDCFQSLNLDDGTDTHMEAVVENKHHICARSSVVLVEPS